MQKLVVLAALSLVALAGRAQQTDWNAPFPPHRIIDNIYYVGTEALASFLMEGDAGKSLPKDEGRTRYPRL